MEMTATLSDSEQRRLLEQPNTDYPVELRNHAILQLFLKHGLRLSEQISMRWKHTDLSTGTLFISGSNGVRDRLIHLSGEPQQTLKAWKKRQSDEWEKRVFTLHTKNKANYVFTTFRGRTILKHYVRRMVKNNACEADIDRDVTINTLRKTFARNLYDRTKNIRQVQKALGHENLSTTIMFTGIIPSQLKQERMPEMFTWHH